MLEEKRRKGLPTTRKVALASLLRRLGAAIIDFISAAFIGLLLYLTVVHPVWFDYLGGYQDNLNLDEVRFASGLYTGSATNPVEYMNHTDMDNAMRYFYLQWDGFDYLDSSFYSTDNPTFDYDQDVLQMDDDNAIILNYFQNTDGSYTYVYRTDLETGAIDSFWSTTYAAAIKNLQNCPVYFNAEKPIRNFVFIGGAISYVIAGAILHLLIPLILDDGRTIGKMATGLAVTDISGYRIRPHQMVLRWAILDVVETAGSIAYLMPLFISVAVMTLSRGQRPIHDWVARTLVIDWRNSLIFANAEEEANYDKAIASGLPVDIYPGGGRAEAANRARQAHEKNAR